MLVVAGKLVLDEVLQLDQPLTRGVQHRAVSRRVTGGGQLWHLARAAAATDARVSATGWCGDDATTLELRAELRALGVRDDLVVAGDAVRAMVIVEPNGERTIVSDGGDAALPVDSIDCEWLLAEATWLHVDGYALDDVSGDELVRVAKFAHGRGITVSLEPPSVHQIARRGEWLSALPQLACLLGRPDEIEAVLPVLAAAPECVVTHDQGNPVHVVAPNVDEWVPVPAEAPSMLGAGDRFAGGVLAARVAGEAWRQAVEAGIAAAHTI